MLQLLSDPTIARAARRCPRPHARRSRPAVMRLTSGSPPPRPARTAAAPAVAPCTDDFRARRRELAELGRLALALAMRESLAR